MGFWVGTAQSPAATPQTVRLLQVQGQADILHAGRRFRARGDEQLVAGDRFQTRVNSHAALLWYNGMTVRISELSDITIPPPPGPKQRSVLEVFKGLIYFFHRQEPGALEIRTLTAQAVVLGTEFSVQVEENGRTLLTLFDGTVEVSNPQGQVRVQSGQPGTVEQIIVEPGQPPQRVPVIAAENDFLQWFLYYPGVLNSAEAGLDAAEQQVLAQSLEAYRSGDLRGALEQYPAGRQAVSDAEKIYAAALLLTVGQVERAEGLLKTLTPGAELPAKLAAALRKLISAVKGQVNELPLDGSWATALLAESYYQQSRANLQGALQAATNAAQRSADFGFAWERVAELEFSFGRTAAALDALEKALRFSPRNAQAHALKGFLLSAQNRIPAATAEFNHAIDLDGGLGNAWLGRGLCRIRRGQVDLWLQDLEIAAALEPQRSDLRSYLGKAWSQARDLRRARHELQLAQELDPKDPTPLFYRALLNQQENRLNEAVDDLEQSQTLNQNRRLYRSKFLLDQDRAVRGVNLANIYRDNGMTDWSVREAGRAVNADYANYSAHLFLANSYNELRDPKQVDLRYETPTLSEYLLANLLAPVGAGTLSPTVSQQEYSKLFERDGLHLASQTEYLSRGAWRESAAQYGQFGNLSYSLEGDYRSDRGQRPNNDLEQYALSFQLKYQITPKDTILLLPSWYSAQGGDLAQYYDPTNANRQSRFKETQEPLLVGGYHHEWSPGQHTLLLASRLEDTFEYHNPSQGIPVLFMESNQVSLVPNPFTPTADFQYRTTVEAYSAELQHIAQVEKHTFILGGRFQTGEFDTTTHLSNSASSVLLNTNNVQTIVPSIPASSTTLTTDFDRWNIYLYHNWQIAEPLLLSAGVSYDYLRYPVNFETPPISAEEKTKDQVSPKAGLIWHPARDTTLRAGYTRSLGGTTFEQSYRLEPTQVAGFLQAFRSLAPESVVGANIAARVETFGLAAEQQFRSGTYLGVEAQLLTTEYTHEVGVEEVRYLPQTSPWVFTTSSTSQEIEFQERSLAFSLNQLLGKEWAFTTRYRLSLADLDVAYPDIPQSSITWSNLDTSVRLQSLLHHLNLGVIYNHSSGFFAQAGARWYGQSNGRDLADLAGDDFWQFDIYAGYRFWQRRAEIRAGILNLADQNYNLYPLNLLSELPRHRTLAVSFRFNF